DLKGGIIAQAFVVAQEAGAVILVGNQVGKPLPGHTEVGIIRQGTAFLLMINLNQVRTKSKFIRNCIVALPMEQAQQIISRGTHIDLLLNRFLLLFLRNMSLLYSTAKKHAYMVGNCFREICRNKK